MTAPMIQHPEVEAAETAMLEARAAWTWLAQGYALWCEGCGSEQHSAESVRAYARKVEAAQEAYLAALGAYVRLREETR